MYRKVRPQGNYQRTLELLKRTREYFPSVYTKSGFMLGLGEKDDEVLTLLMDLRKNDVDIVTIGQYLRPTAKHRPIDRYAPIEEFEDYKLLGESFGIPHVESGPLVRSSYHAKDSFASA